MNARIRSGLLCIAGTVTLLIPPMACDTGAHVCPAIVVNGLIVTVQDAATGAPVCDATVTAVDGAYSETLAPFSGSPCTYQGVRERAGTYSITAVEGSRTATVNGVTVTRDDCNVVTRDVTIALGP